VLVSSRKATHVRLNDEGVYKSKNKIGKFKIWNMEEEVEVDQIELNLGSSLQIQKIIKK